MIKSEEVEEEEEEDDDDDFEECETLTELDDINILSMTRNIANMKYYLYELREKSATTIQAAWRSHRARARYILVKRELLRDKAALVIQRAFRHWTHSKRQKTTANLFQGFDRIREEKLKELQREIKMRELIQGPVKMTDMSRLEETHSTVQGKLVSFYARASAGKSRDQALEAKYNNMQATALILQDSSSLAQNEVDLSWYYCQLLPHATKARLQHKQELCNISKPWWKKLQHDET
uniref:Uncharacterized protein n=1 Tax=Timema tahoe TaxID=61484 RepID=A0A7R9IBF1_9NEOP|nr:unnamed protein product [Timema tahoe]